MKKADLKRRCDKFLSDVDVLRDRGQRLFDAKRVVGRASDKRWLFESLAISLATVWSDFVEDLFYCSVNRDSSTLAGALSLELPKHLTLPTCEAIFTANRYFDIRSSGDLKGKAKQFLGASHPFTGISQQDHHTIDRLLILRNYAVHKSRAARRRYMNEVLSPAGITNLVSPGQFLLTVQASGATRLDNYVTALTRAGQSIKAAL